MFSLFLVKNTLIFNDSYLFVDPSLLARLDSWLLLVVVLSFRRLLFFSWMISDYKAFWITVVAIGIISLVLAISDEYVALIDMLLMAKEDPWPLLFLSFISATIQGEFRLLLVVILPLEWLFDPVSGLLSLLLRLVGEDRAVLGVGGLLENVCLQGLLLAEEISLRLWMRLRVAKDIVELEVVVGIECEKTSWHFFTWLRILLVFLAIYDLLWLRLG